MTIDSKLIASVLLSLIPIIVWSLIYFDRKDPNLKLFIWVFLGGTLTVFPLLGLYSGYEWLTQKHPNLEFTQSIHNLVTNNLVWFALMYSFFGMLEEIIKFFIVRYADHSRPELITTINSSIRFGILSALGFAFSENIMYFLHAWDEVDVNGNRVIFATVLFRSTFTLCAHTMFSGIFAYFYGKSKFASDIIRFKQLQGKQTSINAVNNFRRTQIAIGLILALILHGAFNYLLHYEQVVPVIILVATMFLILMGLMQTKTMNLSFKLADIYKSKMDQNDIETVMEFIGERFRAKDYSQTIEISKRLLQRDPDNNVAKLFIAKATDKLKTK